MSFMKNQLPINQKTFPNCYSHDAIYNAILSSKENIDENFAVIDNVRGFGNENVKVDLENARSCEKISVSSTTVIKNDIASGLKMKCCLLHS